MRETGCVVGETLWMDLISAMACRSEISSCTRSCIVAMPADERGTVMHTTREGFVIG